jgi:hemolysin activation/secretion protein
MNFKASHLWIPHFILRAISLCPALLFALPSLAETIQLPGCKVPDIFSNPDVIPWDCTQTVPETTPPEAAPKSIAPADSGQSIVNPGTVADSTTEPAPNPISSPTPSSEPSLPPEPTATPSAAPAPLTPPAPPTATIQRIETLGNTAVPQDVLDSITKLSIGQPATIQEICKVSEQINQAYRNRGYVVATALPLIDRNTQQVVRNGAAGIAILEGCLESIEVVGLTKLKANYVTSRLALGVTTPFNANAINDRLALLQRDPKIGKLEVLGLSAGRQVGTTTLQIKATEGNFFTGFVGVDNYVATVLGGTRAIGGLTYRNFTNNGDDLSAVAYRSTGGEVYGFDVNYELPINPMDGKIQARVSPSRTDTRLPSNIPNVTVPFTADGLLAELNYRQPILQNANSELALGFGFFAQNGSNTINQVANTDTDNKLRGVKFFQEYTSLDGSGNWSLRSQFDAGLGVFGATVRNRPNPDGRFLSWQGQVQRVQAFGQDNYGIAQLQFQLTPDRLVPDRQFVLSGVQSVRGYRQNVRFGDNGVRLSLENRTILARNSQGQANLQLAINADAAQVWNNGGVSIPDNFLASVGAGILWEPLPKLYTRFDYGVPLRSISDRGNSFQDSGFNLSVGYAF